MTEKSTTVTYYDMKNWGNAYFKCDNCKADYIESHFTYCSNCGTKINWEDTKIDEE